MRRDVVVDADIVAEAAAALGFCIGVLHAGDPKDVPSWVHNALSTLKSAGRMTEIRSERDRPLPAPASGDVLDRIALGIAQVIPVCICGGASTASNCPVHASPAFRRG